MQFMVDDNDPIMTMHGTGVGIGTNNPEHKLHLSGGDMMINTNGKLLF
jgi:hypothetical protein